MSVQNDSFEFTLSEMYQRRLNLFASLPQTEGAVVLLGDSLTQRNQWNEFFSVPILNRGIDSDRARGILKRLDHIITLAPKKVFLMIGINDVFDNRVHVFEEYTRIVERLTAALPNTKVYIQSLLPVNNRVYHHSIDNADVVTLNKQLAQLAEQHGLTYVDLYTHFSENNELAAKYTLDGCHLSGLGYKTWAHHIKPFILE